MDFDLFFSWESKGTLPNAPPGKIRPCYGIIDPLIKPLFSTSRAGVALGGMIFGEVSYMNLQEVAMAAVLARGEALRYVAPSLLSDAALVLAAARMLDCFAGDNGKIQVFQTKNQRQTYGCFQK